MPEPSRHLVVTVDVYRTADGASFRSASFSVEHLDPLDTFGILVLYEIAGLRGTSYFPKQRALCHADWETAYRQACRTVLLESRDVLIACRFMQPWSLPIPKTVDLVFHEGFQPWMRDTLGVVLASRPTADPRILAIRAALQDVMSLSSMRLFGVSISYRSTPGTSRVDRSSDDCRPLRSLVDFTLIHELAYQRPDVLFVGQDGDWYINGRLLKDANRDRRLGSRRSKARLPMDEIAEPASDLDDPALIAQLREIHEFIAVARDQLPRSRPEFDAARERIEYGIPRRELASKYSISEKRIRGAEAALRSELRRRLDSHRHGLGA